MKGKDDDDIKDITKRLDAILAVLLESMNEDAKKASITKRIRLLHASGLRPSEIAHVLGKTTAYVSNILWRKTGKEK